MERHLRTPIKEMIGRHPAVGRILEDAGIGCVPCSVGTCLLSDIVEIHNLSAEDEGALMARIAAVVSPDRPVTPAETRRSARPHSGKVALSPPLKRLVDEHTLIKRFVALIPEITARLDVEDGRDRRLILDGVDFIRSYADRFHHAKEEDILFCFFDESLDVLKAMHDDHRRGRACVQALVAALERRDGAGVVAALTGYGEILAEHIRKEDEILYPWMDRNLSTRQVGEMFGKFREVDEWFGEAPKRYAAFVGELEENFLARGAEVGR